MKFFLLFLAFVCISIHAEPVWVSLDNNSSTPQNMEIKLLNPQSAQLNIEIIVHGYFQETVSINNQNYLSIFIPGCVPILNKGLPELAQFGKLFQISEDPRYDITLHIQSSTIKKIKLPYPIAPSKGSISRSSSPNDVQYEFHPNYYSNRFYPIEEQEEHISLGKPFVFRETRGIRLNVYPASVNNYTKEMRIMTKAKIRINTTRMYLNYTTGIHSNNRDGESSTHKISNACKRLYNNAFDNFIEKKDRNQGDQEETDRASSAQNTKSNKELVVVVPSEEPYNFKDAIKTWVAWKKKCGYNVYIIETMSNWTADNIKQELKNRYNQTHFGYVVLIGDASSGKPQKAQPMPTFLGEHEQAISDRVYVRLTEGYFPDACISRISDTTDYNINTQLDKIIRYEQAPADEWTKKAVLIAGYDTCTTTTTTTTDWQRMDYLCNGASSTPAGRPAGQTIDIKGGLINAGYKDFIKSYELSPDKTSNIIFDTINDGCGIILYIGHGTKKLWQWKQKEKNCFVFDKYYYFTDENVEALQNDIRTPVIFAAACLTGSFYNTEQCFAEAWLRNPYCGAVAIEASSTEEDWFPPCDKQVAIVNEISQGNLYTFGDLELAGTNACLEKWGYEKKSLGNKLAEQVNLFGDCTMIVKTGKHYDYTPKIESEQLVSSRGNDLSYTFTLIDENKNHPIDATVTIYTIGNNTNDISVIASSETNELGIAEISLYDIPQNEQLYYTIVGNGIDAIVDRELPKLQE